MNCTPNVAWSPSNTNDRSETLRDCSENLPSGLMEDFPEVFKVSIVVPTYCEAQNIAELTARVFTATRLAELPAELVIVDDNSCDGTIELCKELACRYPIRLITRTDERGLATAVIRGLREAKGDYAVVMDADLSHPPGSVPELLIPLESGTADFVIGSRYVDGGSVDESWSFFRHLNSRIAGVLALGLTRARDPMAGFFAVRKDRLGDLSTFNPCGYKIGLEIIVRCDCKRVAEVPIHFEDRKYGASKLNLREQWLYIRHLFRLYSFRFPELVRFGTFGAVGASGMIVDLAAFRGLHPVAGIAVGRAMAIWVAMTWNFELNRRVTFSEPGGSHPICEYFRFCVACLLGAGISWSTSLGLIQLTESFRNHPATAAIVGTIVAAVINYALCRLWVFGKRKPRPAIVSEVRRPSLTIDEMAQSN